MCIYVADSLCCTAETNSIVNKYTPIKIKNKKNQPPSKKKKKAPYCIISKLFVQNAFLTPLYLLTRAENTHIMLLKLFLSCSVDRGFPS